MRLQGEDDDRLALRARDGDPAALAELYTRHAPALLSYLVRWLGEPADAEDVLHDTFARLLERRGRYEANGRLRAWLYTVATNLARDRRRHESRRHHEPLDGLEAQLRTAAGTPAPDFALAERVVAACTSLPEDAEAALWLRVRHGLSYRELAEIFDEPEGTLRSRVHHAVHRLREALWPAPPPESDSVRSPGTRSQAGENTPRA